METSHEIVPGDSRKLDRLQAESIALVVTSPPYPLIEMWDGVFESMEPAIQRALDAKDGESAFEAMHRELDKVWSECWRVLKPGGLACVNIGDATRTLDGVFRLWPNHSRIIAEMIRLGFHTLPDVLWRKQTNAPNKFLGSGMLPAGAYVTYEHEYVLIFRKGPKREFKTAAEKERRQRSAFFWEERNVWFSDVWMDLKGERQKLGDPEARSRSGAYPFELAYRLINMFSLIGDTVLDPFLGTGTTMAAAIALARSSVGVEREPSLLATIRETARQALVVGRDRILRRLAEHRAFVAEREAAGKPFKHRNERYGLRVVTGQETQLFFPMPVQCAAVGDLRFAVTYDESAEAPLLNPTPAETEKDGLRQLSFFEE